MNRNKIIIVLVIVFLALVGSMGVKSIYTVSELGHQLVKIDSISDWSSNHNSPIEGIENIGSGLYGVLRSHHVPLDSLKITGRLCDCENTAGFATHSIVVESPNAELCIRLKYSLLLMKYTIVGYKGKIE